MGQVVVDAIELIVINARLAGPLTLRLYGNDKTPAHGDSVGAYTEIVGGGYVAKPLLFANWVIAAGEPTTGTYPTQTFAFTAPINAPGTIYGYYVTLDSDGSLQWAQRFPAANVPFAPISGSQIIIIPKYTVQSQF
jgi:hypothetical protein